MTELRVISALEVDSSKLAAFLKRFFGDAKGEFLIRHGSWWHRGDENRWVLLVGGDIAGYCGVIPTRCAIDGVPHPAVWWMDLVIAPEYRGRGLQTRFDDLVRRRGSLLLGFPNALAADIHRHHGWGVREDLRTLLLPLRPSRLPSLRRPGPLGPMLRLGAALLEPLAALWRFRLGRRRPGTARILPEPDFEELAAVATDLSDSQMVTTWRDASYLRWRYGEGPYQYLFYGVGGDLRPRIVLVARRTVAMGEPVERWLDLFGALEDGQDLADLLLFAAREAAKVGMVQITALSSMPTLGAAMRRTGFVLSSASRFCWHHDSRETMDRVASAPHHWCLGDSDNDEPALQLGSHQQ